MEASLMPYCQGAIVLYDPPYTQADIDRYNLYPKHPVMIATKNYSETTFEYMVFPITSKLDKFCGYRIYLNNSYSDAFYGKMSVIRTDIMHCIDRRYLATCFGYAPPELVQKCLRAYAWHMGMTDEIPDYVLQDSRRLDYTMAGQPNVVHNSTRIEGDYACHGFRPDPETGMPRPFPHRDFIPRDAKKNPRPIIGNVGNAILNAAKRVEEAEKAAVETGTPGVTAEQEHAPEAAPTQPEPSAAPAPEKPKATTLREDIDATRLTATLGADSKATVLQRAISRNRLAAQNYGVTLNKELVDQIKSIPIDTRFGIYTNGVTEISMQEKLSMSRYKAHKIRMGIIAYITEGIEKIAVGMRKFEKDCKFFVSDEEILFLRCMLPYELKYARAQSEFYENTMRDRYFLNYETDTVTGIVATELKKRGKPMIKF